MDFNVKLYTSENKMPWRSHWNGITLKLLDKNVAFSPQLTLPFDKIERFAYTSDGWVIFDHKDENLPKIIIVSSWGLATYRLALALQQAGVHTDAAITKRNLVKHYALIILLIVAILIVFGGNYLQAHVIDK